MNHKHKNVFPPLVALNATNGGEMPEGQREGRFPLSLFRLYNVRIDYIVLKVCAI